MSFRFASVIVVAGLLLLQGCNSGSEKVDPASYSSSLGRKSTVTESFAFHGRVNKGSLIEGGATASVTLHPFVSGKANFCHHIASVDTEDDGSFDMYVDARYGGQPALMIATIVTAEEAFDIHMVVPALYPDSEYSITLLTHISSVLTGTLGRNVNEGCAEGENKGILFTSNTQAELAITDSISRVASRFGVIGNLPYLDIVDISNSSEGAQSDLNTVRYSALGNAILIATLNDHPDKSIQFVIDRFSKLYAPLGVAGHSSTEGLTGYAEILKVLMSSVRNMQSASESASFMDDLLIELATEYGLANIEGIDQYDSGVASGTSGLSYVDKAKALVQDIRQVVSSIDVKSIVGLSDISKLLEKDTPAAKALEGFGVKVDISEFTEGEQSKRLQGGVKIVTIAALDALAEFYSPNSTDGDSSVVVQHGFDEASNIHSFVIQQQVDVCEEEGLPCLMNVDLSMSLYMPEPPTLNFTNGSVTSVRSPLMEVTLNGLLSYGGLSVEVFSEQAQISVADLIFEIKDQSEDNFKSSSILFKPDSGAWIDFSEVKLTKQTDAKSIELKVALQASMSVGDVSFKSEEALFTDEAGVVRETESDMIIEVLKDLDLNVAAVISEGDDEKFLTSINLRQPGEGFIGYAVYRSNKDELCALPIEAEECEELRSDSGFTGENIDQFIQLNASIGYKANLKGISVPVIVRLSGSREGPDVNKINGLKLTYPGHALSLNGQFNNGSGGGVASMRATSLDGISMSMDPNEQGDRQGTLVAPDGGKLATIIEMGRWVKVSYIDGWFDSL